MTENRSPEDGPPLKPAPRTLTITLPSWTVLGVAFLTGVLLIVLVVGAVFGYRYLDHRQRLESARIEMAALFKSDQSKASSLLEIAGRDAAQLQTDLSAALMAPKSSAINTADFATRQGTLAQDLSNVQAVFLELGQREQVLIESKHLSPNDTLFSLQNQEQFNQLQKQWQDLNGQQPQLVTMLQDVAARKESLLVAEEKAVAQVAAKKAAQARAQAQARSAAQAKQNAPVAVFGAPAYYNYSNRYYTAPIYQPNYQPYYYRRPYGGYGYGYGW